MMRKSAVYAVSTVAAAIYAGGVPERSKGADCKSAGSAFGGSNPPPSTRGAPAGRGRGHRGRIGGCSSTVRISAFHADDVGSTPITRSAGLEGRRKRYMPRAHIAQSVEHFLGKEEVTGSNPVVGSSRGLDGRRRAVFMGGAQAGRSVQ